MAFLDKLGQVASKVGEVAGDAVDLGAAKSKAVMEKGKLKDAYEELGKYAYEVLSQEGAMDPEKVAPLVAEVKTRLENIERLEAEAAAKKEELKADVK